MIQSVLFMDFDGLSMTVAAVYTVVSVFVQIWFLRIVGKMSMVRNGICVGNAELWKKG